MMLRKTKFGSDLHESSGADPYPRKELARAHGRPLADTAVCFRHCLSDTCLKDEAHHSSPRISPDKPQDVAHKNDSRKNAKRSRLANTASWGEFKMQLELKARAAGAVIGAGGGGRRRVTRANSNADRVRAYRKRKKDLGAMPSTSTVQSEIGREPAALAPALARARPPPDAPCRIFITSIKIFLFERGTRLTSPEIELLASLPFYQLIDDLAQIDNDFERERIGQQKFFGSHGHEIFDEICLLHGV
ncbi:hypothetical protein EVAR_32447_1 [Eumeta japonica]|uniref:Uncharacterized protein n=1 Tax=Eumeta variegata TaxID=151549 RepID=A0A4C1VLK3_EUMVA|nr:hypothetical protein EVAR_32447_1 [Eumeta japonica]